MVEAPGVSLGRGRPHESRSFPGTGREGAFEKCHPESSVILKPLLSALLPLTGARPAGKPGVVVSTKFWRFPVQAQAGWLSPRKPQITLLNTRGFSLPRAGLAASGSWETERLLMVQHGCLSSSLQICIPGVRKEESRGRWALPFKRRPFTNSPCSGLRKEPGRANHFLGQDRATGSQETIYLVNSCFIKRLLCARPKAG